jgi:outer membrane protein assembly factor BamA
VKGDIDYSETFRLSENGGVAFHAGLGVAYPYGNSSIMPFEKRYYAGGPNSVRGWKTRYLGPGSLKESNNMVFHVGDVNFILSAEYRYKILNWLEPAVFVDCGNIWTIKDYPNQHNGLFKWDSFYKELAVGTGIGLRFDLSFLILRFDVGTRVYDPKIEGNRFVFLKKNFMDNSATYVAIGYPF